MNRFKFYVQCNCRDTFIEEDKDERINTYCKVAMDINETTQRKKYGHRQLLVERYAFFFTKEKAYTTYKNLFTLPKLIPLWKEHIQERKYFKFRPLSFIH